MKHVFLINSFAVKDKVDEVVQKVMLYCDEYNLDFEVELNSLEENTEQLLEKYKEGEHLIIVIGGDGIINRVLNCIASTKNKLGFIPYGTGNDFYKSVKKDLKPGFNKVDIARINNKYFINTACFGIDADVANNKNMIKTKLIPRQLKYYIALLITFFKYKCRTFEVKVGNKKYNQEFTTIAVANGSYYGGSFNIAPLSDITDNLLDIYLVDKVPKLPMINLILKLKNGKHEGHKNIEKFKTNKIYIKSKDKIIANIDGEELEDNEFKIELIKHGIEIYYDEDMINELK